MLGEGLRTHLVASILFSPSLESPMDLSDTLHSRRFGYTTTATPSFHQLAAGIISGIFSFQLLSLSSRPTRLMKPLLLASLPVAGTTKVFTAFDGPLRASSPLLGAAHELEVLVLL